MNSPPASTAPPRLPAEQAAKQEADQEDYAIITQNLTRKYGDEVAVADLTMRVPTGAIFGFIGPSGSGKTTTVRMLTGVHRPTSGSVRVLGEDPATFSQNMRARLGYMPQLFVLYPELTVWENLNFAASLYGMPLRRHARMNEILQFVELSDDRDKLARDISGGMQRRLTLAATLIHRPELLFLDEPTAGVDPVLRRKFWDRFRELHDHGRTLFVTTQYVNEASYCDLVGVLHRGRLLMVDTPEGLRYRAFGGDIVDLVGTERITYGTVQALSDLDYVKGRPKRVSETHVRLIVDDAATAVVKLLSWCEERGIGVDSVEEYQPPFDDVFVELVEEAPQYENDSR
ncbi:MAG TPA: ABC transporter ATP-binding protein [Candidatus Binatia bacterium]|jgi:ABC-2 type transport system ATP-binding protein|nr:ABC transporter ATP-binding protein [Candidatus Binatia bacterium]